MSSSSESELTWVQWFCSLTNNEFFCEIDDDFLFDRFNATGLQEIVPQFEEAIEFMSNSPLDAYEDHWVDQPARLLYGLIHARYLLTLRGQQKMLNKYRNCTFGTCNLYNCNNQPYLPVGLSDQPDVETVKMYCPKCENIYLPRSRRYMSLDGAFFGTTFPHLLFMVFPEYRPSPNKARYIPT